MRRLQRREPAISGLEAGPRALIWLAVSLLLADAAVFAVTGRELIVTGPETETLGQGAVGFMLIVGAFWLAVAALLGLRFPRTTGLVVLVIGVLLFVRVAGIDYERYYSGEWYVGEQEWSDYWLAADRIRDPSGLGGIIIESRALSLMLFLVPPICALVLLAGGCLRHGSICTATEVERVSLLSEISAHSPSRPTDSRSASMRERSGARITTALRRGSSDL